MYYRLATNRNFWIMFLGDIVLVLAAYTCAYLIRFDGLIPTGQWQMLWQTACWLVPLKSACFFGFNLYKGMWRFFSVHDLISMIKACMLAFAITVIIILALYRFEGFSRSVFVIDLVLTVLLIGGFRLAIRMLLVNGALRRQWYGFGKSKMQLKNMVIIGAGSAGEKLLREIHENNALAYDVVGFVDDEPVKLMSTLHGVPVLGSLDELEIIIRKFKVHEITIAVPSASARKMRRIVNMCKSTRVPFKTLPGLGELVEGRVTASAVREVRYEDLLGRAPVELDQAKICDYVTGKRVMVTGGAGSIGSELCRQIARYNPRQLIIVERNESPLYELELELQRQCPGLKTVAALGTIQNYGTMAEFFNLYRPQTVFHAAAYKHVPMMENHPWEAVFNNVLGSKVVIKLCATKGVERCVAVSTDKAVRPASVMGATKRLVELITMSYAAGSKCRFMAVRFGNVLGSAGSVLPLFKAQIEAGGPVTVTDPQMTRYFMTIPEACSLILQSGALGKGNEIFVLKMGTPVNIDTMARDLITLSGFIPDKEIEIHYTGLRPGEKLYEELIIDGEDVLPTKHEDIMALKPRDYWPAGDIDRHVEALVDQALKRDENGIKRVLCKIVPEYNPVVEKSPEVKNDGVVYLDEARFKRMAN